MIIRNPWILILDIEILSWAFPLNTQTNIMIQLQKVEYLCGKAKDCLPKQIFFIYCTYYEEVIIC